MRTCTYRLEDMTPNSKQVSRVHKGPQHQTTFPADALAPSFIMVSHPPFLTFGRGRPDSIIWHICSAAEHATDDVLITVCIAGLPGCETVQHLSGRLADHKIAAASWKLATGNTGSQKFSGAS